MGFDPTADSLHLGNLLGIVTLMRLQRAGHRPIALAGGGTGMVGDPSGKAEERQLLTPDVLAANLAAIRGQLERFLDFGPDQALLLDNGEWLGSLGLLEFLRDVGKHFTVNAMIAKESVRARLSEREQGISYTEFSYMLLQAYDFLHLFESHNCTLQLGGSDQWGNITAGIDLIRRVRGATAYGLTFPLVIRADGTKFGKSEAGNVWLDPARTSPYAMYQFMVRSEDAMVGTYLRLFTFRDREEIEALDAATASHPERREAQRGLAHDVVALVHGEAEAEAAEHASSLLFSEDVRVVGGGRAARRDGRGALVPGHRRAVDRGCPRLGRAGVVAARGAGVHRPGRRLPQQPEGLRQRPGAVSRRSPPRPLRPAPAGQEPTPAARQLRPTRRMKTTTTITRHTPQSTPWLLTTEASIPAS